MPKLSPLMWLALAAGAYFLFLKKPAASPMTTVGPAPMQVGKTSALPGWVDPAKEVFGDLLALGTSIASEKKAMDGMAPASLEGHMASLGAYGELAGSFYGGC